MALGFCLRPAAPYHPFGINQDRAANDAFIFLAVHLFLAPSVVSLQYGVFRVTEEIYGDVVFLNKFLMRGDRIGTDTQNLRV